ncbi:MAG: hypothetical protein EAZ42_04690 [Verrucomicrobia bacterium]|nr:MAG: hypothetical protein EAZ42_04690 [Verrucomicrobiota bacterium]
MDLFSTKPQYPSPEITATRSNPLPAASNQEACQRAIVLTEKKNMNGSIGTVGVFALGRQNSEARTVAR